MLLISIHEHDYAFKEKALKFQKELILNYPGGKKEYINNLKKQKLSSFFCLFGFGFILFCFVRPSLTM